MCAVESVKASVSSPVVLAGSCMSRMAAPMAPVTLEGEPGGTVTACRMVTAVVVHSNGVDGGPVEPRRAADDRGSPTTGQDFMVDGAAEAVPHRRPGPQGCLAPSRSKAEKPRKEGRSRADPEAPTFIHAGRYQRHVWSSAFSQYVAFLIVVIAHSRWFTLE